MMNLMRNCDRTTMRATMGGKEVSIRYSMRTSIADIRLERDWPSLFRFSADPFHMRRDVTKRTIMAISSLLVAIGRYWSLFWRHFSDDTSVFVFRLYNQVRSSGDGGRDPRGFIKDRGTSEI